MDAAQRDRMRARLGDPHTRAALSPVVTERDLVLALDALDDTERKHATVLASLAHALAQGDALRAEAKDLHDRMTAAEVRATRAEALLATATASVQQLRADVGLATAGRDDAHAALFEAQTERDEALAAVKTHREERDAARSDRTKIAAMYDAARDAAERAERERDDARAEVDTLRAEAALMREIIEGRTTPPTDAEKRALDAAGGGTRYAWSETAERWWAHDADGRPCAWPTVTP